MPTANASTLQKIIETTFARPLPLVEDLFNQGETALFIARQKEGKSGLTLQIAIDVSCGDPFLDRYKTTATSVLYIDYENRPYRLQDRGKDLANGRRIDNLRVEAFDFSAQRNLGLFGSDYINLKVLISAEKPGLLILDPLRYARSKQITKNKSDADLALEIIDQVSELQVVNPGMSCMLVHYLKKRQNPSIPPPSLKHDPRSWIDQIYGSQALNAHVDNIWGLERTQDGYTFATVPRSEDELILSLEKQPGTERFFLASNGSIFQTDDQEQAWKSLPIEFGWREVRGKYGSSHLLRAVIVQAMAAGLLTQDSKTKRYRKVTP